MKNGYTNEDVQQLQDAALFALGPLIGMKSRPEAQYFLAKALKQIGSDCTYLDPIIAAEDARRRKKAGT